MAAEGWALYAEALMAEPQPGAPNGFYTPEEHLYQLQGKLYRDLRVRIDTGIHTGRISYDDAVTLFSEVEDFLPGSCMRRRSSTDRARPSAPAARRPSARSSATRSGRRRRSPTGSGSDQIFALREEAAKKLGDRFSPKQFHLLFMRAGDDPVRILSGCAAEAAGAAGLLSGKRPLRDGGSRRGLVRSRDLAGGALEPVGQ